MMLQNLVNCKVFEVQARSWENVKCWSVHPIADKIWANFGVPIVDFPPSLDNQDDGCRSTKTHAKAIWRFVEEVWCALLNAQSCCDSTLVSTPGLLLPLLPSATFHQLFLGPVAQCTKTFDGGVLYWQKNKNKFDTSEQSCDLFQKQF